MKWMSKESKKIVLFLGAVATALLLYMSCFVWMPRAKCAWCPSYTCYSSSACGTGCVCVKFGGSIGGSCASID